MTRKDWWLGIGVILLALLIQTAILLYAGRHDRDDQPRAKRLTASRLGFRIEGMTGEPPTGTVLVM
jgi:hypothetical protein